VLISHVTVVITFSLKFNIVTAASVTLEQFLPCMLSLMSKKQIKTFENFGALFACVYNLWSEMDLRVLSKLGIALEGTAALHVQARKLGLSSFFMHCLVLFQMRSYFESSATFIANVTSSFQLNENEIIFLKTYVRSEMQG